MGSFFDKEKILKCEAILSEKNSYEANCLKDILVKECSDSSYKVYAIYMNRVAFGSCQNATISLAEGLHDDRYFLEMRVFNPEKEIFIKKSSNTYMVRVICDNQGYPVDIVDTTSNFMGENTKAKVGEGCVELYEPGRKIRMILPGEPMAKQFALKTRSYITYDEETCQAGFGYYRFVDICVAGKE